MSDPQGQQGRKRSLVARVVAIVARLLGAGVYQLTIRAAVTLCTAALFVYFTVNSPSTVAWLGEALQGTVPGRIQLRALRWGPSPGHIRLHEVRLLDPDGAAVVAAQRIDVALAWLPLVGRVLAGERGLKLRLDNLAADGLVVRFEETAAGDVRLLRALIDPEPKPKSSQDEAAPFALTIDRIGLRGGAFHMDLAGTQIDVTGMGLVGEFRVEVTPTPGGGDAAVEWGWSARGVEAAHGEIRLDAFDRAGLAQLPGGKIRIASAVGGPQDASLVDARIEGEHTVLERADIAVRWAPELDVKVRRGALRTRTPEEPFLGRMLGDLFAAETRFVGEVDVDAAGRSHVRGEVEGSGRMAGFDTRRVRAKIDVHSPTVDGDIVDVVAQKIDVEGFGGRLRSDRLTYHLAADGLQRSAGVVRAEGVSIAEALASPAIGMSTEQSLPIAGTVSGEVAVDVQLRTGVEAGLWMEAKTDLDLEVERDPRAGLLVETLPKLHFRGGVDTIMDPGGKPARPLWLRLRGARLSDRALPDDGGAAAGATYAAATGEVDLAEKTLSIEGEARAASLGNLLRPFGVKGVDGALRLDGLQVGGPFLRPTVRAGLRATGLVASGTRIDELRTEVALQDDVLKLKKLSANLAQGRAGGDLELDLFAGDVSRIAKPIRVRGKGVSVRDVELGPLLAGQGVRGVSGRARLEGLSFKVDLDRPARTLQAAGHLAVNNLGVRFERFDRIGADFRFGGGRLELPAWEVQIPPLQRRGEPPLGLTTLVKGTASVGLERGDWALEATFPTLRFEQLGEVRALAMPLHGTMEGTISASGGGKKLALRGDIGLRGLAWDKIVLGDGRIGIDKELDGPATLSSGQFFPRFALKENSVVTFRGLVPEVVSLQVRAERFDPWELLALPPMNGIRPFVAGDAKVRFDFRPGQTIFAIEAQLPPGGAEIELDNGLDTIRNRMPAMVKVLPDRVELGDTELAFGTEAVELCGTFFYPNEAEGKPSRLAYFLAGHVEVPRFGALSESLANLELGFDIGESTVVRADPGSRCLTGAASRKGAMRLAGPLDAIAPTGRIVLANSRVVPRGYGREIMLAEGAVLDLRPGDKGLLQLQIPKEKPLEGRIEDGRFKLWGDVSLDGYAVQGIDMHFDGVDLAYAVPKEYALVVTPTLRFRGHHLQDAKRRDMLLSGNVLISEGQYSKSFDKLGKVIGGVRGRELDGYSEPLLERMPWIGAIRFDLGLRGQNFEVLSRFPFGRTDLELGLDTRVRGTMAAPELYGRVEVQPGSMLTYSVVRREFEVTEGSIDFNGAVDKAWLSLEARAEIPLDQDVQGGSSSSLGIGPNLTSSTSGQVSKVTVVIRIAGPLDDPRRLVIGLSSTPALDPADIQSLILTGQLLTSRSASGTFGSRDSFNLLTDELAEAFQKMLLSAFVDSISIGIPTSGGINAKVTTSLGKAMTMTGKVFRDSNGSTESSATFSLRLGERWSLEGLLRSQSSSGQSTSINVYEAKLRYRVPLPE